MWGRNTIHQLLLVRCGSWNYFLDTRSASKQLLEYIFMYFQPWSQSFEQPDITIQDIYRLKSNLQSFSMLLWLAFPSGIWEKDFNGLMRLFHSQGSTSKCQILLTLLFSYFQRILFILSSPLFYTKYVRLPKANDPVPLKICQNAKFWPFFKDAIGVTDGSHIHSSPPAVDRSASRNCKGYFSQNCFFACSFDLLFVYALTGWEGSASDARVWEDAHSKDFSVPEGKYYLVDAGFPSCKELLTPYRSVRYHLAEWGRAGVRYECIHRLILSAHLNMTGPQRRKNCLIFSMLQPAML